MFDKTNSLKYVLTFIKNKSKNYKIMKKVTLCIFAWCTMLTLNSQSYSTDFEEYVNGDFIGELDDNWDPIVVDAETSDVPISDSIALSGNNSLYFSRPNTADFSDPLNPEFTLGEHIYLYCDDTYTEGKMTASFSMYVEEGTGGSFHLSAGNSYTEEDIAVLANFFYTGEIVFNAPDSQVSANFPFNEWFSISVEIDFDLNKWDLYINETFVFTHSSTINAFSMIKFSSDSPTWIGGNEKTGFFVDDVSYVYTPFSPNLLDIGILSYNNGLGSAYGLVGGEKSSNIVFRNIGMTTVSSFDVEWAYGNQSGSESFNGLSLPTYDVYEFQLPEPIVLEKGVKEFTLSIVNLNGGEDEDISNNTVTKDFEAVTPYPGKIVVLEEATGTWCAWCPRGLVYMEYMHEQYDGLVGGIAVHIEDPMATLDYSLFYLQNLGDFLPSFTSDRTDAQDVLEMEQEFIRRIEQPIAATIDLTGKYDGNQINLSATINAIDQLQGYRFAIAIVEDEVTGSGAGWAQNNNYAGGGEGPMGGYENLPNPVPASDIVYQEVARAILGGPEGNPLDPVASGSSITVDYTYTVLEGQNIENIRAIAMLIEPGLDRIINNAALLDLSDVVSSNEDVQTQESILAVYPNPAQNIVNVNLQLKEQSTIKIMVRDLVGKSLFYKDYGQQYGDLVYPINVQNLPNGLYLVEIIVDDKVYSEKMMVLN